MTGLLYQYGEICIRQEKSGRVHPGARAYSSQGTGYLPLHGQLLRDSCHCEKVSGPEKMERLAVGLLEQHGCVIRSFAVGTDDYFVILLVPC